MMRLLGRPGGRALAIRKGNFSFQASSLASPRCAARESEFIMQVVDARTLLKIRVQAVLSLCQIAHSFE